MNIEYRNGWYFVVSGHYGSGEPLILKKYRTKISAKRFIDKHYLYQL